MLLHWKIASKNNYSTYCVPSIQPISNLCPLSTHFDWRAMGGPPYAWEPKPCVLKPLWNLGNMHRRRNMIATLVNHTRKYFIKLTPGYCSSQNSKSLFPIAHGPRCLLDEVASEPVGQRMWESGNSRWRPIECTFALQKQNRRI